MLETWHRVPLELRYRFMASLQAHEEFVSFIRRETRFEIGGTMASERLVRRLAGILETRENYERLRVRVREWSKTHTARSWGIMICLAEDVIVRRTEPAVQAALPFNVVSIAERKPASIATRRERNTVAR